MKIDERDTMFARMNYSAGSEQYQDYYKMHPEKKEVDDTLRERPELYSKETPYYDEYLSKVAEANFDLLADIRYLAEETNPTSEHKTEIDHGEVTKILKKLTMHFGALDVGIALADEKFFYSHRGRLKESYGDIVDTSLKNALVFTIEMNEETISTAPATDATIETSSAYVKGATIGLQLQSFIRKLGYRARNHMDGNYLLMAVPLAIKAGLGEKGRNGLLVSKAKGCFCRIGVITTDMPLIPDDKTDLEIGRFCNLRRRCIKTCPGKTISSSDNPKDWYVDQVKCYTVWRNLGTDCGICICACPLGQDLPVESIRSMSDEEITIFLNEYQVKYRTRKRRLTYFKD